MPVKKKTENTKTTTKTARPKTASKSGVKKKLKPAQEKFIENVAKGMNQTDAYQDAYPKAKRSTARNNAARLLANASISDAVKTRKEEAALHANVTNAQVLGATAKIAFASIEDAHDEQGYFDYQKAVKSGAVEIIKSISRTPNKYGEAIKVEFYSKQGALDRIGDYLGMRQKERDNETDKEIAGLVQDLHRLAEKNGTTFEEEKAVFLEDTRLKPEIRQQLATEIIQ